MLALFLVETAQNDKEKETASFRLLQLFLFVLLLLLSALLPHFPFSSPMKTCGVWRNGKHQSLSRSLSYLLVFYLTYWCSILLTGVLSKSQEVNR